MRSCAVAVLLFLSLFFLLRRHHARARARAGLHLQRHLGPPARERGPGWLRRSFSPLERLEGTRYALKLRGHLESSGIGMTWAGFKLAWLSLVLLLPALALAVTGRILSVPAAVLAAFLVPMPVLDRLRRRMDRKAAEQCDKLASDLALYLRCGIPVEDAITLCVPDLTPPLAGPLSRFRGEVALGSRPDTALLELVGSLDNPDLELIAKAVITSHETGADIRGIMEAVGEALRERAAVRRELYSQTVQGRLSGRIVAGLPLVFLGLSALVSRGTLKALFGTYPGLVMLAVAAVLNLLGFLWIRRILDIKG